MTPHAIAFAATTALAALPPLALAQTIVAPATVTPTQANTPTASSTGFESGGVPASGLFIPKTLPVRDGVGLTPTLGVSYGHTDNVALAPSSAARSSSLYTLTPKLLATTAYRADRYSLGYQGEIVRYPSSKRDNAENHEIAATAENSLDTRLAVNTRLSYQSKMDGAGTTDRISTGNELDRWRGLSAAVVARYGAPGARGKLEVELGAFDKKYQNNRATTQDADYSSTNFATRFGVRVAPKTTLLLEYRNTRFDYKRDVQNLDNTEQRYLVGAEWEATALTSGSFKVGYLDKGYKRTRNGYGGLTWEGGVSWKPLTYSSVDLITGRSASDPTGNNGDYVKNSFVSANWTHRWSSFLSTRVSLAHSESDYVGTPRADKTDTLGLAVNYDFRRWVRLGGSYEYSKRSSSTPAFDYDRNQFSLFAEFGF